MAKGFTFRLAAANLRRSRRMMLPYFMACTLMAAMYFIISNLIDARAIANMSYGETTMLVLSIGRVVMTVFIAAYMFYLNSFLIKPRKKEFGLYGVLGLEKRHIARLIFVEGLLLNAGALAMGLLCGCAFGELFFRALLRVTRFAQGGDFRISSMALSITVCVFGAVFLLTTVYNLLTVYRSSPVALLSGEGKAEKRPRFVPLMAVLGFILLICSYGLAITTSDAAWATFLFWPLVLLVILATYLLFTAGSAFFLSVLSRRPQLYYKPRAFITIGFLKHRMKQNAAGLSNICILSSMVLVTLIGCGGLYFGQEDILRSSYVREIRAYSECDADDTRSAIPTRAIESSLAALCEQYGVTDVTPTVFDAIPLPVFALDENALLVEQSEYEEGMTPVNPQIIPADSYTALTGIDVQLAPNEVLILYPTSIALPAGMLGEFTPVAVQAYPAALAGNPFVARQLYIIAPSRQAGRDLALCFGKEEAELYYRSYFWADLGTDQDRGLAISKALRTQFSLSCEEMRADQDGRSHTYFSDIYEMRAENYALYGGLIFLGIFCAILFAVNTVLIIYFKQLSEGYEDRERYEILQKVGMDSEMVRRTINFQVLFIFFLPLLMALLHTVFAFPLLTQIMAAFNLHNTMLTLKCALIVAVTFSIFYAIVFKLTARTYYHLVKR